MNKNDLNQISKLLDDKLETKLNDKLAPIHKKLDEHSKILKSHDDILKSHSKTLDSHGKILKSLKKTQDTMLKVLDTEQMQQRKRLKKIEDHVGITSIVD